MPAPAQNILVRPPTSLINVSIEPVNNILHSLILLTKAESVSGLATWVTDSAEAMSAAERSSHLLVMIGLHYTLFPDRNWYSFPAYLDHLEKMDPVALRDRMINAYLGMPCMIEVEPLADDGDLLRSEQAYIDFLTSRFGPRLVDPSLEAQAYAYAINPTALKVLVVSHLRTMWEKYMQVEWRRVRPMLEDSARAFRQAGVSQMERFEAAEFITGQRITDEHTLHILRGDKPIVFVPSAHVGPYMGKFQQADTFGILFGARLPEGTTVVAPDLSRAEVVVRLTALADDTRLRILKLVAADGELSSQEIMQRLGLSQSATSRHLKQLSANGFLAERRCEGAKCYSLNGDRIRNTLDAVSAFLAAS